MNKANFNTDNYAKLDKPIILIGKEFVLRRVTSLRTILLKRSAEKYRCRILSKRKVRPFTKHMLI